MFSVDREKMIYNYLKEHDTATTEVLSEITGASLASIHRDPNQIRQQGKILKKHGRDPYIPPEKSQSLGWTAKKFLKFMPTRMPLPAQLRSSSRITILFLGASKVCSLIARYIQNRKGVTIVTTSIDSVFETGAI